VPLFFLYWFLITKFHQHNRVVPIPCPTVNLYSTFFFLISHKISSTEISCLSYSHPCWLTTFASLIKILLFQSKPVTLIQTPNNVNIKLESSHLNYCTSFVPIRKAFLTYFFGIKQTSDFFCLPRCRQQQITLSSSFPIFVLPFLTREGIFFQQQVLYYLTMPQVSKINTTIVLLSPIWQGLSSQFPINPTISFMVSFNLKSIRATIPTYSKEWLYQFLFPSQHQTPCLDNFTSVFSISFQLHYLGWRNK